MAVARLPEGTLAEELAASTLLEVPALPAEQGGMTDAPGTEAPLPAASADPVPLRSPGELAPEPARLEQRRVKIHCPNCKTSEALPCKGMGSLLCCSHCWQWYRVADGGKLTRLADSVVAEEMAAWALMDGPSRSDDGQCPEPDTAEAPPVVSTDLVPLKATEEGPTDLEPPPPPKQSQLKLHCPNCNSPGALPWGRLGSLLCCAHCWHWYRISGGGKLTEVPPPKNFVKGSLRAYNENGESRIIEVTRKDIKQKRREAQTRQNIAALKSLNVSDGMVLWMAAAYTTLLALFLGYTMFRTTSAPLLPNAPSSVARGQTVNPRKKAMVTPSPASEPDNPEAPTSGNSDDRRQKAFRRGDR